MNFENQTRLIEMRERNPKDPIHLVYDSSLLNAQALAELHEFCVENNITPVDADKFYDQLQSDKERILYKFYKDEVNNLNKGGNLGVASDILRWLSVSYRLGSYTDLDVPLDTRVTPKTVSVDSPLLLNIGSLKLLGTKEMLLTLNEYIAVVDEEAAKEQINKVHEGLIKKLTHYSSDYMQKTEVMLSQGSFLNRIFMGYMKNRAEALYIQKSTELELPNGDKSSRGLRAYVNEVMTSKEKYLDFKKQVPHETHNEIIKRLRKELQEQQSFSKWLFFRKDFHENKAILSQNDDVFLAYMMKKERSLYLKSIVICTTGPIEVANSLYNTYVMTSDQVNKTVKPSTFSHYGLHNAFLSRNVIPLHENPLSMMRFLGADVGELNDSSWLEEGMNLQQVRQKKLLEKQKQLTDLLPSQLLDAKHQIEQHLQKLEHESKGWFSFLGRSRRDSKITALKGVLACFDEQHHTFDVARFNLLSETLNRLKVFAGFFTRKTEQLIQNLEQLCHEAVVLRVVKGKKLSVGATKDSTSSMMDTLAKRLVLVKGCDDSHVVEPVFKKQRISRHVNPTNCVSSLYSASSASAETQESENTNSMPFCG